jgi:hypothetical protein
MDERVSSLADPKKSLTFSGDEFSRIAFCGELA